MCHCGRALHYSSPRLAAYVSDMVEQLGERVEVSVGGRTWLVPRHYIALHGLRAAEVPSLGFELLVSPAATSDRGERESVSDVPGENQGKDAAAEGAAEEATEEQTDLGAQWEQDARNELAGLKAKGDDATEGEKARIAELEERFTAGSGPPAA